MYADEMFLYTRSRDILLTRDMLSGNSVWRFLVCWPWDFQFPFLNACSAFLLSPESIYPKFLSSLRVITCHASVRTSIWVWSWIVSSRVPAICHMPANRTLVRSMLELGSPLFTLTNRRILLILDRAQHMALKVVLGCMKSSPFLSCSPNLESPLSSWDVIFWTIDSLSEISPREVTRLFQNLGCWLKNLWPQHRVSELPDHPFWVLFRDWKKERASSVWSGYFDETRLYWEIYMTECSTFRYVQKLLKTRSTVLVQLDQ